MKTIRFFFLARRTVMSFLVAVLLELLAGGTVPQRFLTPTDALTAWHLAHPLVSWLIIFLGLDHLFTSPLFIATLFLFSISLAISIHEQCAKAWSKTFAPPSLLPAGTADIAANHAETLHRRLRAQGYLHTWGSGPSSRFTRHPWGYWGLPFLHLGILLVIVASLTVFLTTSRGLVELHEDQIVLPGEPIAEEEHGLLARPFRLPMAMRMISVERNYWETDDLKQLTTNLQFVEADGSRQEQRLGINQTGMYKGLKMYQSPTSGMAFSLDFRDAFGIIKRALLLSPRPLTKGTASYRDFRLPWLLTELRTKYYTDIDRQDIESDRPQLVLQLAANEGPPDEVALLPGEEGRLGPYTVRLVDVKKWAGIVCLESTGMPGVFGGFFLLIIGSILQYFTPPREVLVTTMKDGRLKIFWRASRFCGLYTDEFKQLRRGLEHNGPLDKS